MAGAKMIYTLYFSPTGTTRAVLRQIGRLMGVEPAEHDLTPYGDYEDVVVLGKDDFALFGFPVYEHRVPGTFRDRLRCISGDGTPAAIVCTYGNCEYGDALLEMRDIAADRGFFPIAAAAVAAEHNVIRSVAAGRPDEADMEFIKRFCAELSIRGEVFAQNGGGSASLAVPGDYPYHHSPFSLPWHRVGIRASADCIACGLCEAKCPVGAIPADNPRVTQSLCIGCMRCTRICPKHARRQTKLVQTVGSLLLAKSKRIRKEPEMWFT